VLFSLVRGKQALVIMISKILLLKIDSKEGSAPSVCLFLSVVFVLICYFCVYCVEHSSGQPSNVPH